MNLRSAGMEARGLGERCGAIATVSAVRCASSSTTRAAAFSASLADSRLDLQLLQRLVEDRRLDDEVAVRRAARAEVNSTTGVLRAASSMFAVVDDLS
jgi:hypothetical protein